MTGSVADRPPLPVFFLPATEFEARSASHFCMRRTAVKRSIHSSDRVLHPIEIEVALNIPFPRSQRTIGRPVTVNGFGFFTNAAVTLTLNPAPENYGRKFVRVDLDGAPEIRAEIDFAVERHRRTVLKRGEAEVELTEHVLAALAGMAIDNCRIELDACEAPGCDGSARPFVDAILSAEIVEQAAPVRIVRPMRSTGAFYSDGSRLTIDRAEPHEFTIRYELDYGAASTVPTQTSEYEITPDVFAEQIAPARTFIDAAEIEGLKKLGYGQHVTAEDLLVLGENGPIDNELRFPDECARHKILDCVGDFALIGCDISGRVTAQRSGHALNRQLVRQLRTCAASGELIDQSRAA
ncbi:UDP-3-O-acyl-N-acetylglucosamine deacetylase [Stratiformator vulcanicus]|uniref:UDP-3-O-acyl-N-acetylglucosamine deacetylase n=1 Tax=Stratiformator vulcanicus TaxID=2527980 RepID=A0A517R6F7_9PLAN|nr:UDP-3-O-acyl-N-acetylglucosamine deacetylase [Stratiformator vulcanicus]QDT39450.1 UDP-3-O-[3-hydroxymyristoyl] N-acetylglucosamine deacetylase [Stratiformator vulcanicus]